MLNMTDMLARPANPGTTEVINQDVYEVFVLPEAGAEVPVAYITALKDNCPFVSTNFANVCFAKYLLHPDYSLTKNQGKPAMPKIPVTLLTPSQATAIKECAKGRYVTVPRRRNPEYDPDSNPDVDQYLPSERVCIADYLVLEPVAGYQPMTTPAPFYPSVEKETSLEDDLKDAIIKGQTPKNKGSKQ